MLSDVAVIVQDGVEPFELGLLCEVFGVDRPEEGCRPSTSRSARRTPGPGAHAASASSLDVDARPRARGAGRPGVRRRAPRAAYRPSPEVVEALRAAVDRGARVLSVCTGAFVLGEAGLLDGRECTTHWMHTDELARRYPRATVVPEVLYVDAGQVITSAGSAAGIDAGLHLWRAEYGARGGRGRSPGAWWCRRTATAGRRSSSGRPWSTRECETFGPVLEWIREHLDESLSVDSLADRFAMSPRTFARRFREETGTTPHAWITAQRVLSAEELLEGTDHPVERVATEVGFGNAAALRHHFTRARGVSPQDYRRTFGERAS